MNTMNLSLGDVNERLRDGRITLEQATEYIRGWNMSGKHMTIAYIRRNFRYISQADPATKQDWGEISQYAEAYGFRRIEHYFV